MVDEPEREVPETPIPAGPPPDEMSPMQKAIVDGGGKPVEGNPWAFTTNEGTVFIASPQDMERSSMMDGMASARFGRMRKVSSAEIDRMMGEEGDDSSKWRR